MPSFLQRQFLFIGLLIMLVPAVVVAADAKSDEFDRNQEYDIYFYSGEYHTSVLQNVNILGFKEIAGKEFLVVRSKGFKLTEESGYIDFDSVIAILPGSHFRVRKGDGVFLRDRY